MATTAVLVRKTVSITELRQNPTQYFGDQSIAVSSNNKLKGYVIGAELFERMVDIVERYSSDHSFQARFRPSSHRLEAICSHGAETMANASDSDMEDFAE
ncbi:type I toxin-antitoxin system antitoxin YafN [Marinobacter sp. V034]|uniref:type I toxin-antitoxin system antitoxin YafN n=1 Tax=Marinobacter sp. V034 TaxID=3459610 RepID=UPI0040447A1E